MCILGRSTYKIIAGTQTTSAVFRGSHSKEDTEITESFCDINGRDEIELVVDN